MKTLTLKQIADKVKDFEIIVREEAESKIIKFTKELLLFNNPYPVGSIIEDHCKILKVKKIKFGIYSPSCIYEGVELTKKLEPKKSQIGAVIYQSNVQKVHYLPEN